MSERIAFQEHACPTDWQLAHRELTRLARSRAGLDYEEGRWLLAALRGSAHVRLGYGSFVEYVERLFGYGPRLTQDKLRVAQALEELPSMTSALQRGQVCWSVLRELTRVATRSTERDWLDAARNRTAREVEKLVSGHRLGSRPEDPRDAVVERHVMRFEVSGEVLASFREALATIRQTAGSALDDDAALLLMARQVLEGPHDDGRASYQVALTICESCQRGQQQGRGNQVEVGADIIEMARCDGQHLGWVAPVLGRPLADSPDAHVGHQRKRAVQHVPPAVRRLVKRRDGGSCVFPGCHHATFVDVHHLKPRSEGGRHDPNELVTLCGAHHRALHRGHVFIEGDIANGLRFRHADDTPYGAAVEASVSEARAKAFRALRKLGFGETETRQALAQATHVGDLADVEHVVRHCLHTLTVRQVEVRASA